MMSPLASGVTRAPFVKLDSELKGDCDWPLPFAPLFFTYQTRPERFSVTVPVAVVGVPVVPVSLEIVYVKLSVVSALAVTGGVYLNVPSAAIVTLPLWVVANVPATTLTPPLGRSLARIEPDNCTAGVAGAVVVPPVTYASVLFTRLLYESPAAAGRIAIEKTALPVQLVLESVAVTVKLKVPVADGVPLIAPAPESERPVGSAPPVTANV